MRKAIGRIEHMIGEGLAELSLQILYLRKAGLLILG